MLNLHAVRKIGKNPSDLGISREMQYVNSGHSCSLFPDDVYDTRAENRRIFIAVQAGERAIRASPYLSG